MGWRLGPGPVGGMQSAWPSWPARPRETPDELKQWQGVGSIYWLDTARSISFLCAFIRELLVRQIDHGPTSWPHYSLNSWLTYLFIALTISSESPRLILFWIGSAADHRPHKPITIPFQYSLRFGWKLWIIGRILRLLDYSLRDGGRDLAIQAKHLY